MESSFPAWLCTLLYPAGLLYRTGIHLRNSLYRRGVLPVCRLDIPVVSDGSGPKVSAREAGDEPIFLAQALPTVAVVVCRDRVAAARTARNRLGADLVLLDDGFQHRHLARDLDLLLVEAGRVFGNGRMLPCGPLREPLKEMARADALVVTGRSDELHAGAATVRQLLSRQGLARPVFPCERRSEGFIRLDSEDFFAPEALQGMKAVAFSGIAFPGAFEADLRAVGLELAETVRFRDHQWLGPAQLNAVRQALNRTKPDVVITTEKDRARLGTVRLPVPGYALRIRMVPHEEDELLRLVAQRLTAADSPAVASGR